MQPEIREQIIKGLIESFAFIGAENYEEAMKKLEVGAIKFLEAVRNMNSVDKLRQLLDDTEVTESQEQMLLGAANSAPAILAMFIRQAGEKAETTLPRQELGRPAIGYFTREKILDFIALKVRRGFPLKQAKYSAALHFNLSGATIQRIWNKRGADKLPDAAAIFEAMQDGTIPISLSLLTTQKKDSES